MIVVSDTSPLSALITLGRAEILQALYGEVIIPGAVWEELSCFHAALPKFLRTISVGDRAACAALSGRLDPGESEAIVLAEEMHAGLLLMDESIGRKAARARGLQVVGLVGVLIQARRRGLVPPLAGLFVELREKAGFYLASEVERRALRETGELA